MKKGEFNPIGISDQLDWQRIKKLLSIGLVASIVMLIGDMLIGWGVQDESLTGAARMFSAYREAGNTRLFWSALLGMLGMWIEGLSYFGIYRLMAQASPKHAHQYRTGIIGYIVFGPCGFHVPVCMAMFVYRSLTQAGADNIAQTMTQFAKYFILPSFLLFWLFFIILEWAQISAFAQGMTSYPKWCWIFSLPVGMIIAKMLNIFGNHAWVNAIDCGWISVGNLWMFGGLLIMMRKVCKKEV